MYQSLHNKYINHNIIAILKFAPLVPRSRYKLSRYKCIINFNFLGITQNGENIKEYESSAVPKPPGRNLDAVRRPKKLIPVDFDLKVLFSYFFDHDSKFQIQ